MSKPNSNRVRNWPRVEARIDPELDKKFHEKLKKKGHSQSDVIRKAVRNYTKED